MLIIKLLFSDKYVFSFLTTVDGFIDIHCGIKHCFLLGFVEQNHKTSFIWIRTTSYFVRNTSHNASTSYSVSIKLE